jgi:hypothetical protein
MGHINLNGIFYSSDGENWKPLGKITQADIDNAEIGCDVDLENKCIEGVVVTGTVELSEEAQAAWWAIAEGGIEIVKRSK